MKRENISYVIIGLLLVGIAGFFVWKWASPRFLKRSETENPLPLQNKETKQLLPVPSAEEFKSVSGKIVRINGPLITLQPIFAPTIRTLTVAIQQNTKIIKLAPKNPQEIQEDIARNRKDAEIDQTAVKVPLPFREISGSLTDLQAGDSVRVTSADTIQGKEKFTATEIRILADTTAKQ